MTSPSAQKAAGEIVTAILHGDDKHQAWLKAFAPQMESIIQQAITEAVDAAVAPKDKRVKELEAALRKLMEFTKDGMWTNEDGSPHSKWDFDAISELAEARKLLEAPHEP